MANSRMSSTSISTAPNHWRRQFHHGWIDAQNGRPWAANYDGMARTEQIAYEQGRLLVREAMAAGFGLCIWRGDKAGARPVEQLWSEVAAIVGRVVPDEWREPKVAP